MDTPDTASTHPPATSLALRRVGIDTYRENVAYLHRDCAIYRAEGFQASRSMPTAATSWPR